MLQIQYGAFNMESKFRKFYVGDSIVLLDLIDTLYMGNFGIVDYKSVIEFRKLKIYFIKINIHKCTG